MNGGIIETDPKGCVRSLESSLSVRYDRPQDLALVDVEHALETGATVVWLPFGLNVIKNKIIHVRPSQHPG